MLSIVSVVLLSFPAVAETGIWSKPVLGLRGRLVVEATHIGPDGNHRPKIYLELEQSYEGNPLIVSTTKRQNHFISN